MLGTSLLEIISNAASTSVILLSFVNKLPQIVAVLKARDARGLSSLSSGLMLFCYTILSSYGYANGFALKNYLESILLAIQEIILLSSILYYQGIQRPFSLTLTLGIYVSFIIALLIESVPVGFLELMLMCVIPVGSWSKALQMWKLYQDGHPGQVSVATWSVSAYGCLVRVITSFFETGSILMIANYAFALTLNTSIVIETLYYSKYPRTDKQKD